MGTLIASDLINQIGESIQDESHVIWERLQILGWLNDSQLVIASERPDASFIIHSVTLVPGTKQSISGLRFMGAVRNMGVDGLTPGRAIRLVERGIKDDSDPNWHIDTAYATVKEYIYDARTPQDFYVSPPVPTTPTVQIEISEAVAPATIAAEADTINIDDIYAPMMIEWAIYKCMEREAEETPSLERAAMHFQNFYSMLSVKLKPDMVINPKVREHLK